MKSVVLWMLLCVGFTASAQSNAFQHMKDDKVQIEIWSDVVCPFCYLGKNKLEKAIAKFNAQDQIKIVWRSYQLDPEFPENTSQPSAQYLSARKGVPVAQVEQMSSQLASAGTGYGIDFNFGKALTFNTKHAHRLIQWAKTFNQATALKTALMKGYFTEGLDLSNNENLLLKVKEVGLDAEEAGRILASDDYAMEVWNDIQEARSFGIRGVPFFLIDGEITISGAQSDQVFEQTIAAVLQKSSAGTQISD